MTDYQHEFYAPFAHIPNRYEWCRIHSTSHGSFDCFIVIVTDTAHPVTVYVTESNGDRFMADRFPESTCIRVTTGALGIDSSSEGRRVDAELTATAGPVTAAKMIFEADATALPVAVEYGDAKTEVWGSRFSCRGVDLNVPAVVTGFLRPDDGTEERFAGPVGVIALGSYGRLERLP